jgi:spermidine/putrescine transport system ATP-binding protein
MHPAFSTSSLVRFENVCKSFGKTEVLRAINIEISGGEFFSFLGPSGCGKTTCLRILAGFEEPSSGEVYLEGNSLRNVPPNVRPLSMVFQDYSLFPHMTIFQNVAFGLVERKEKKSIIEGKVAQALELIRLAGFQNRKPSELSGGQKQRVAIARSIVLNPKLLLLDEPLGALDLKLRKQMQLELKSLQSKLKITFIYVTHDQEEALTMSSRIAVLEQGNVKQIGSPIEIYKNPANRFVADFIGETTFLDGTVLEVDNDHIIIENSGMNICAKAASVRKGSKVTVSIRPESIKINEISTQSRNAFTSKVLRHTYKGSAVEYTLELPNGKEIRATCAPNKPIFKEKDLIVIGWNEDDVVVITE